MDKNVRFQLAVGEIPLAYFLLFNPHWVTEYFWAETFKLQKGTAHFFYSKQKFVGALFLVNSILADISVLFFAFVDVSDEKSF